MSYPAPCRESKEPSPRSSSDFPWTSLQPGTKTETGIDCLRIISWPKQQQPFPLFCFEAICQPHVSTWPKHTINKRIWGPATEPLLEAQIIPCSSVVARKALNALSEFLIHRYMKNNKTVVSHSVWGWFVMQQKITRTPRKDPYKWKISISELEIPFVCK